MTDIVVTQNQVANVNDCESLAVEYLKGLGMKIPEKYETQFIELCKAFSLNPFKRECYAVGYGDKYNIITGYEVYIKRAERTGKLDGWKVDVKGSMPNMTATITIHRKDWKMPFEHTVLFAEAKQNSPIWQKQPSFMLKKVAMAQGFRLCFPDELGGMPYTSDELPEIERNITKEATVLQSVDTHIETQNAESKEINPKINLYSKSIDVVNRCEKRKKNQNDENNSQVVSNKFADLLQKYQNKLGNNYTTAYETFQTGSDAEMVAMYERCVSYLNRKGIKVV